MAPYNVTKSGVVALSEGLFLELGATGSPVKVSVLCPGFVKTSLMVDQRWTERLGTDPGQPATPMGQLIDDDMLNTFAVVAEPEHIADELHRRYGDVIQRISFYAPYRSDPDRWRKVLDDLKSA